MDTMTKSGLNVAPEKKKPGRKNMYYEAKEMTELFPFSLSYFYKHPANFGGRMISGKLCFPRVIVDKMLKETGAV